MHIQPAYAELIAAGVKTVELRAARWSRRELAAGHLIHFHTNDGSHDAAPEGILVRVLRVTDYITEGELLDREDPATILGPGATGVDVAALLDTLYPDAPPGYVAIEIEPIDLPAGGNGSAVQLAGVGNARGG
jgi:ASC-1-like (ASCH) protein